MGKEATVADVISRARELLGRDAGPMPDPNPADFDVAYRWLVGMMDGKVSTPSGSVDALIDANNWDEAINPIGTEYHCLRCGHHWHSRKAGRPRSCGGCKSTQWQVARVDKWAGVRKAMEGMR